VVDVGKSVNQVKPLYNRYKICIFYFLFGGGGAAGWQPPPQAIFLYMSSLNRIRSFQVGLLEF